MKEERAFLLLWTLAVSAATAAFVLHLGLRVRSVELGYELGRSHAHVQRLREVRHVLEVELGSQKTPERVDFVARTLLGMSEPTPDRVRNAGARPHVEASEQTQDTGSKASASPAALDETAESAGADEAAQ